MSSPPRSFGSVRKVGIRTMSGRIGVWLDTPLLDAEHGPGTVEKHFLR